MSEPAIIAAVLLAAGQQRDPIPDSDLDDAQPISLNIRLTLGDVRRARRQFAIGTAVGKIGGDYRFDGHIRAIVVKSSGAVRYVVEDDRGILFIWRHDQFVTREGK